eukprot:4614595-Pyramimonas_sp.AAC.1
MFLAEPRNPGQTTTLRRRPRREFFSLLLPEFSWRFCVMHEWLGLTFCARLVTRGPNNRTWTGSSVTK